MPRLLGIVTGLLFQERRCKIDGIGRDFLKVKKGSDFLTIDLYKQIQRSLSIPFFTRIRIDVVHEFRDIRLGKMIHRGSFGDHIPYELMVPFAVAFLVAVHRIAIENPALYNGTVKLDHR